MTRCNELDATLFQTEHFKQLVNCSRLEGPECAASHFFHFPCGGRMDHRPGKSLQACWAEPRSGMWWQEEAYVLHDAHRQRGMLAMKT